MNIAITHPGKDGIRFSAEIIANYIKRLGHFVSILSDSVNMDLFGDYNCDVHYDILMVSVLTSRDVFALPKKIKEYRKIANKIIVGGLASRQLSKNSLKYIDAVVYGNIFSEKNAKIAISSSGFVTLPVEKSMPDFPISVTIKNKEKYYILKKTECPNMCKYCCGPTGNLSLSDDEVIRIAKKLNRPVNIYTPDGDISEYLYTTLKKLKIALNNRNYTPDAVRTITNSGYNGRVNTGIEGLSRKMRSSIGRSIDDDLWKYLLDRGATHFYLICGLPGEEWCDYEEMLSDLASAKKGHTLTLTPLEWSPYWMFGDNTAQDITWAFSKKFCDLLKKTSSSAKWTRKIETHRNIERMNGSCPFL